MLTIPCSIAERGLRADVHVGCDSSYADYLAIPHFLSVSDKTSQTPAISMRQPGIRSQAMPWLSTTTTKQQYICRPAQANRQTYPPQSYGAAATSLRRYLCPLKMCQGGNLGAGFFDASAWALATKVAMQPPRCIISSHALPPLLSSQTTLSIMYVASIFFWNLPPPVDIKPIPASSSASSRIHIESVSYSFLKLSSELVPNDIFSFMTKFWYFGASSAAPKHHSRFICISGSSSHI
jgi:hypothetical protein